MNPIPPINQIRSRKLEHLMISLKKEVQSKTSNGFDDITLIHRALPEINKKDINVTTEFFGREISAPIIISAMTGGHEKAKKINKNLALAAQELNIPMGVGSQRAAIEDKRLIPTYTITREAAPEIFLIANIGAVQFCKGYDIEKAKEAVRMIYADALAIHLNPLQESVMPEGDVNFKKCLESLKKLDKVGVPLIGKETGAGIAREEAILLEKAGFAGLDISGLGGTSFSAVEYFRRKVTQNKPFLEWGIPTSISTIECVENTKLKVIASGGIRNGVEVAKALTLGATACGIAQPLLSKAMKGHKDVVKELNRIIEELKTAMFLVGAERIEDLRNCNAVLTGKTRQWLELRGIDCKKYANRRK